METNYLETIESRNIVDILGGNKSISERKGYSNMYT